MHLPSLFDIFPLEITPLLYWVHATAALLTFFYGPHLSISCISVEESRSARKERKQEKIK